MAVHCYDVFSSGTIQLKSTTVLFFYCPSCVGLLRYTYIFVVVKFAITPVVRDYVIGTPPPMVQLPRASVENPWPAVAPRRAGRKQSPLPTNLAGAFPLPPVVSRRICVSEKYDRRTALSTKKIRNVFQIDFAVAGSDRRKRRGKPVISDRFKRVRLPVEQTVVERINIRVLASYGQDGIGLTNSVRYSIPIVYYWRLSGNGFSVNRRLFNRIH